GRLVPDVHGVSDRDRGLSVGFGPGGARPPDTAAGGDAGMSEIDLKPAERLPHYVSAAPFDPYSVEEMTPQQERFYRASQWRMMWWRLRRHRLAVASGVVLLALYVTILFCEILAPYALDTRNTDFIYAPPQAIHIIDHGRLRAPFVYGYDYRLDMTNLRRVYTPNPERPQTIRFFCRGDRYLCWGLIPGD